MKIKAGAAETIITPPIGVEMLEPRNVSTTGIHDELYARALVLSDGATAVAIVALDLLGLDADLVNQIRQAVFEQSNLPAENLMLNTSHTHSAPVTLACCPGTQENVTVSGK